MKSPRREWPVDVQDIAIVAGALMLAGGLYLVGGAGLALIVMGVLILAPGLGAIVRGGR